jgi:glycosyltransferase involved in cell wall biosynthesis
VKTVTILLPCLNEAETIRTVVLKSFSSLSYSGLKGEVLVADNGSKDGSQAIALSVGARVLNVTKVGYGAALQAGIQESKSDYIIMGDADDSYALDDISEFLKCLDSGFELVIGNRFKGGIKPGAMPFLHRYLGNPVLSFIGRLIFKVKIKDFHCGLRAFRRESILALNLKATGMEFASEMIVKASLNNLRITEVPTVLSPDGRSRKPHLKTWSDGWRHLIFLLTASPRWLFMYPGFFLVIGGLGGVFLTSSGPFNLGTLQIDLNSFYISIGLVLVGSQTILFGILARISASNFGILPNTKNLNMFMGIFTLERGILSGIGFIIVSVFALTQLLSHWDGNSLGGIDGEFALRLSGIVVLTSSLGFQLLFASFFASLLKTK